MIADARDAGHNLDLRADVVVLGAGIGGAAAALELARAGLSTVVLEEGGDPAPARTELETRVRRLQQRGFLATLDRGVGVLAGRLLGGSFDAGAGELWRVPDPILEQWAAETGADWLGSTPMAAAYGDVEGRLAPRASAAIPGDHPLLRAAGELGWSTAQAPIASRQVAGADAAIPDGERRSVRLAWIDPADSAGAAVLHHTRADRVAFEDDAVLGVMGSVVDRGHVERRFRVQTRAVVAAAGALSTPGILLRSGVPDPRRLMGDGLRLQPTAAAVGLFDGATLAAPGLAVTEFTDGLGADPRRVLLRATRLSPGVLAGLMPWTGDDLARELADADHRLTVAVTVRERRGERAVPTGDGGAPSLKYETSPGCRRALREGLERAAEWLLTAGAREVWTSHASPVRVMSTGELGAIRRARYRSCQVGLLATTPLGTCPLGARPRRSVVDAGGRHHRLRRLYVADASLLPGAPGMPLGSTVAVIGREVARTVVADLGSGGA